jgi:hypothetical protein
MNRLSTLMRRVPGFLTGVMLLVNAITPLHGQSPAKGMALPFPENEKLIYEIKFNRFPLYTTLGHITFEYKGAAPDRKIDGAALEMSQDGTADLLRLKAEAVSKGMLVTLIGINVNDTFETLVNRNDFSAQLSLREEEEGKKHISRTSYFDPFENLVRYRIIDLSRTDSVPRVKDLPRKTGMQSLLSAIYYVRTFALNDGDVVCFPVSEEEENYEFEIFVRGREPLEFGDTKLHTIKIEPRLFGPGRYFNREGEMQMWLTDDERRVPVRLVAKTSAGTIIAQLINYDAQPPLRNFRRPSDGPPEKVQ